MHPDIVDILANQEVPISNEQLIRYLTGELSDAENHAIERQLAASRMDTDALEGLMMLKNAKNLSTYRQQLKNQLYDMLGQDPPRRQRRKNIFQQSVWIWLAIVLILVLLGYALIHFYG